MFRISFYGDWYRRDTDEVLERGWWDEDFVSTETQRDKYLNQVERAISGNYAFLESEEEYFVPTSVYWEEV